MVTPRPIAENLSTASNAENLMTAKHVPSLKTPQPRALSVMETILLIIRDALCTETSRPNDSYNDLLSEPPTKQTHITLHPRHKQQEVYPLIQPMLKSQRPTQRPITQSWIPLLTSYTSSKICSRNS